MENLDYVKSNERYEDFIFLDKPIIFNEFFRDKDYDVVQIHDINRLNIKGHENEIIGFAGAFKWKNNNLIALDGDSYDSNVKVYGYDILDDNSEKVLDILVKEW